MCILKVYTVLQVNLANEALLAIFTFDDMQHRAIYWD